MRRLRSNTVQVTATVDISDVDDADIRAEVENRGLDVLGIDLDDLRRAIRKGSLPDVLYAVERALPGEFSGLYEQVLSATRKAA